MLANSVGGYLENRDGIPTRDILEMFLACDADGIHVIYGGNYDVNMLLRDVARPFLETLYATGEVEWHGYIIRWRPSKSFHVTHGERSFLLYDILPFFQTSFVNACDEYLGTEWEGREHVIREKARRGSFQETDLRNVAEYNRLELVTLVRLANELRERLHKVEIRVSRWDGPGAIASAIYQKYETKSYRDAAPVEVARAARYAYAGGRFELIRKGHTTNPTYQYDIRSAYPSALRGVPCLVHGHWRHVGTTTRVVPFGVYRVQVTRPRTTLTQPHPLFMRNRDGTVYYTQESHGWYWTPEAELGLEMGGVIHEGWEWVPECEHQPFHFIEPLYNKRAALKKAGDGAHVGLKLGLNSLYGKLAQQVGYDPGPPLRIPPFHCLEWAGYTTSHCRANVYRATLSAPHDVIAFETDAVFSRVPLDLPLGTRLGEWDETVYSSLTYYKSGMYYATKTDGTQVEKCRGINKGSIDRGMVIRALARDKRGQPASLPASQTRFITLGQALHQNFDVWRHWITGPRIMSIPLNGKRIDLLDSDDAHDFGDFTETEEGFHETTFSYPYKIAWIDDPLTEEYGEDGLDPEEIRYMLEDENYD